MDYKTKCYLTKIVKFLYNHVIFLTETVLAFRTPVTYADIVVLKKGYSHGISSDILKVAFKKITKTRKCRV